MTGELGKLLRIYVSERDEYNGRPLYEALIARCQELNLAGATAFRGIEGFGDSAEIHGRHLLGNDQPIVITIVERPEKAREALRVLQSMIKSGVIAVSDVEVAAISNGAAARLR